jgi:anti-sigma B factor antagonist
MEVKITHHKRCDVIQCKGRIDSATAPDLRNAFDSCIDEGRYHLVLDMQEIDYMSSAGLRELISAQKKCKKFSRGEVVLVNVSDRIREALDLAGFVPLFTIYSSLEDAVGSF